MGELHVDFLLDSLPVSSEAVSSCGAAAPSFMGCGWCRNRNLCSRSAQCETSLWSQDSCPILITEVFPTTAH
ncbi:hypothetical protein AOLI_G00058140 [Acnodon oligacanthus]